MQPSKHHNKRITQPKSASQQKNKESLETDNCKAIKETCNPKNVLRMSTWAHQPTYLPTYISMQYAPTYLGWVLPTYRLVVLSVCKTYVKPKLGESTLT